MFNDGFSIAIAKAKGVYKGRRNILTNEQLERNENGL